MSTAAAAQLDLADYLEGEASARRTWIPPVGRELLRIGEMQPRVEPIYAPDMSPASRKKGRGEALDFLSRHHYLHRAKGALPPPMTWAFGLYFADTLAAVTILNPPAAGVVEWLYGHDLEWRRRVIAATRVCALDAAPFGTESHFVSKIWRLLPHLDDRFTIAVALSDMGVVDPFGHRHIGGIYQASNAWWAGMSVSSNWRGFLNPATGARISRKCGGRNRSKAELPPGWVIERGTQLNRYLWFVGPRERGARAALNERVRVAVRPGWLPVWQRPLHVHRGDRRAYGAA